MEERDREFEEANRNTESDPNSPSQICDKGLKAMWVKENTKSIDGLPSITFAPKSGVVPIHAPLQKEGTDAELADSELPEQVVAVDRSVAGRKLSREEIGRLVLAFSVGLAVAAVYVQLAGVAC